MITSIHHTGIVVRDLEASQKFYCELLGLSVVGEIDSVAPPTGNHTGIPGARRKLVFLGLKSEAGQQHLIELVHYIDPPAASGHLGKHQFGCSHLCFTVEDLEFEYGRMSEAGVVFETAPIFCDTTAGRLGVVYARDPEGNWIELIEGVVKFD